MVELFNITHDANNLNEYDSTITDGGDLSTGTPGLADTTAKMEALIDSIGGIYGQKNFSSAPGADLRMRFYFGPNTLTIPGDGDSFYIFRLHSSTQSYLLRFYLGRRDADGYWIRSVYVNDVGTGHYLTEYGISDGPHYAEFHLEREGSDGAGDGRFRFWLDGVLIGTHSSLDNWSECNDIDYTQLGAIGSIDADISGTIYLDELKANDDGSEIGPVVAGGVVILRRRIGGY